jgi:hypothetical protein
MMDSSEEVANVAGFFVGILLVAVAIYHTKAR